jgi:hypothetical protein
MVWEKGKVENLPAHKRNAAFSKIRKGGKTVMHLNNN